jgi:hypothetical protein
MVVSYLQCDMTATEKRMATRKARKPYSNIRIFYVKQNEYPPRDSLKRKNVPFFNLLTKFIVKAKFYDLSTADKYGFNAKYRLTIPLREKGD